MATCWHIAESGNYCSQCGHHLARTTRKKVWQWRYCEQSDWKLTKKLMNEHEASEFLIGYVYEKHAGPFEVPL